MGEIGREWERINDIIWKRGWESLRERGERENFEDTKRLKLSAREVHIQDSFLIIKYYFAWKALQGFYGKEVAFLLKVYKDRGSAGENAMIMFYWLILRSVDVLLERRRKNKQNVFVVFIHKKAKCCMVFKKWCHDI